MIRSAKLCVVNPPDPRIQDRAPKRPASHRCRPVLPAPHERNDQHANPFELAPSTTYQAPRLFLPRDTTPPSALEG
ncbi:hypothetical protein CSOJ01_03844 [Colletotrichum sojae]|uniref:Uncharacterized protein n=1 Tax=Colletotrichum sojae TaxID=2175907 RepID=A0A8H6N0A7_9PEZI|nr:hypothetical protein CSOJ01_03844 [Colletotrichum sojae]